MSQSDFEIKKLGQAKFPNPAVKTESMIVSDNDMIPLEPQVSKQGNPASKYGFELAGLRPKTFFNPQLTRAAIVSCGGICPGLNAVIRGLVLELNSSYGISDITGIRYGYHGFSTSYDAPPIKLTKDRVRAIHQDGGTILGSSRGTPGDKAIVNWLEKNQIDILFTIGGDGTMRGAQAIQSEVEKRGLDISIVGLPKTIDNDIPFVRRSFGFETAVERACEAIKTAYVEARSGRCIGVVRLMGRHAGYIAASATLSTGLVDFCLIPESPFYLSGKNNLLNLVENRLNNRKDQTVIVIAEGAGQHLLKNDPNSVDASGNPKMQNTGEWLKKVLTESFPELTSNRPIKYVDPSYMIRSSPANASDNIYCRRLSQAATHAAMAGKTGMLVGNWHGHITHIPMSLINDQNKSINVEGALWNSVLSVTGQPRQIGES